MHDPDYYPNPDHFDGLRYTRHRMRDDRNGERERENPMFGDAVTEVRREFPVWGFGGHVWFVFPFPSSPPPSILPTITHPPHFSLPPPPLIHTQIYPHTNPPTHKSTHAQIHTHNKSTHKSTHTHTQMPHQTTTNTPRNTVQPRPLPRGTRAENGPHPSAPHLRMQIGGAGGTVEMVVG